ncbi:MAG: right-handed parallel beta-helix repeat-containing protein, partial [Pseudomonas sp.]|nr:right-handed parallel beta-helix repeat-containing protein [Pseudomonas sp.]
MNLHPHLRHSLLASALLLASGLVAAAEPKVIAKELQQAKTYTVASAPIEPLQMDPPKLPDLTGFTAEAVQKKIDRR